jgi:uncharacterized membrane protein YgaE (UPF0421/DUF939 family)
MRLDLLTAFVLQNLEILVLVGVGITAIGVAVAIFLSASERRRPTAGSEGEQKEVLQDIAASVRAFEKSLEDLENQRVKTDQEFASQLREVQKQVRSTRKDVELLRREVAHLENMVRMITSGTYDTHRQKKEEAAPEKENVTEDPGKSGFWHHVKEAAEYVVPIWGQWKLIKRLRKKKTGS